MGLAFLLPIESTELFGILSGWFFFGLLHLPCTLGVVGCFDDLVQEFHPVVTSIAMSVFGLLGILLCRQNLVLAHVLSATQWPRYFLVSDQSYPKGLTFVAAHMTTLLPPSLFMPGQFL